MAANQVGKTVAGAAEFAMHLTGQYPDWWKGRRWDQPIRALAGSESAELTTKGVQRLLLGPPEDENQWGTGYVPADSIIGWTKKHGVPNAVHSLSVKHESGGASVVGFPSYDQGRSKWQADTVDVVWYDEEPDDDVYSEGLTRTNATGGIVYMTFTPLKGMSTVVARFLLEDNPSRKVTVMTIDEAEHFTPEVRAEIVASYQPHEVEARTKGIPILGSGRVFPVPEEQITCAPFEIPGHYRVIGGLDFGWDHPFGGVQIAWDIEADVIYVTKAYRMRERIPLIHAAAIKDWAPGMPWAWPHDGLQHEKGAGEPLAAQYRKQGLKMLEDHATHEDGSNYVEPGIIEMLGRMQLGKFKVFAQLAEWFEEYRLFHRKDGKIVKLRDDLLSATRTAIMMKRKAVPLALLQTRRPRAQFAEME